LSFFFVKSDENYYDEFTDACTLIILVYDITRLLRMYHRIKIKIFAYGFNLAILESYAKDVNRFLYELKGLKFCSCSLKEKMRKSNSHDKLM